LVILVNFDLLNFLNFVFMKRSTVTAAVIMMAFIVFNLFYLQIKTVEESRFEEWLKEAEARMFIPLGNTSDSTSLINSAPSSSPILSSSIDKGAPSGSNSVSGSGILETDSTVEDKEVGVSTYGENNNNNNNLTSSLSLTILDESRSESYELSANDNKNNQNKIIRLLQLLRESSFFSMPKASSPSYNLQVMTIEIIGVDGSRFSRSVSARALQKKTSGMLFLKLFELYTNSKNSQSLLANEKVNSSQQPN